MPVFQKEAKKRQQERKKSSVGDNTESNLLQVAQDDTLLSTAESARPQPPKMVDKHKVSNVFFGMLRGN